MPTENYISSKNLILSQLPKVWINSSQDKIELYSAILTIEIAELQRTQQME